MSIAVKKNFCTTCSPDWFLVILQPGRHLDAVIEPYNTVVCMHSSGLEYVLLERIFVDHGKEPCVEQYFNYLSLAVKRLVLGERTFPHELPNQKRVACSAHYTFETMNFQDVFPRETTNKI